MAVAAVIGSCNLRNPGLSLPPDELTYPNALVLSPGDEPDFLYVANTNFDLRYNASSVHSYNLASIDRELLARNCKSVANWPTSDGGTRYVPDNTHPASPLDGGSLDAGDTSDAAASGDAASEGDAGVPLDGGPVAVDAGPIALPADFETAELSNPPATICNSVNEPDAGDCCFDTPDERNLIREDAYPIDSYGVGLGVAPDGKRLYVPVSSQNQLVYLDVANGKLSCGSVQGHCRRGPRIDGFDEVPDDSFPGTLSAMAVGKLEDIVDNTPSPSDAGTPSPSDASTATFIATTHEFGGFSLFVDRDGTMDPVLESVGHMLPQRPRAVLADPRKHLLYVASASTALLSRLSVHIDPDDDLASNGSVLEPGPRELFYQSTPLVVSGLSQPLDTRDLTLDPRDPLDPLNPGDPSRIYAMVRGTQESVGFFELDPGYRERGMRLIDAVRVGAGPSKIKFITMGKRSFLLVSCYDAKTIYIIDPDTRRLVSVVRSLSGPFEMAFDEHRSLLHVTDFRASVLRVVDLAGLVDATLPPPRIIATIGLPHFKGVK